MSEINKYDITVNQGKVSSDKNMQVNESKCCDFGRTEVQIC